MIWLMLSILLNTYIGIVFHLFKKFGLSNLQGIIINYLVCILTGMVFSGINPFVPEYFAKSYFPFAIVQGFCFFVIFYIISIAVQQVGISATQTANKLSLVIPVVAAYFLFHDSIGVLKMLGILLAGIAVILVSKKENSNGAKSSLLLPIIIFFGSGFLDSLTSFMQQKKYFPTPADTSVYIMFCFASAFVFGGLFLLYQFSQKKETWNFKNVIGGVVLGIPNYFSIYTFIMALDAGLLQASALVPVNNIAVVFASTIFAIVLFKEKVIRINWIGLAIALVSIACIIFGDN
jgi:drug/metabolite transporter (DMT)-like permease